ncbi:hypothetical protein L6452_16923 [Arctium lappa]|uniref:Uncharacterized protein n=1 Tax=Arctium lappa TaxID=4217 RepID=A0ACB9C264_ARCLA|nr:hypothetical protein L6452_16923 [Arctium lappa]
MDLVLSEFSIDVLNVPHDCVLVISQNLTCNSNDFRGLKGFMDQLESPIDGWWPTNSSSICCNWVGIPCNSSSGRIVGLELQHKRLTGILSDLISNLDQLRTLDLSQNFLKGPLPISLFHLPHLEVVDLSSNEFDGVLPVTINLPAFQVLDISDNAFTDGSINFNCSIMANLTSLNLGTNSFSGTIPANLASCLKLKALPNLMILVLTMNFHTEQLSSDDDLQFKALKALVIANCRLTDISLDEPFPEFPFLKKRDISGRGLPLQYHQIVNFPPSLDLSSNFLTGPIWPEFGKWKKLHVLDLKHNNLSGRIPSSLSGNPGLCGGIDIVLKCEKIEDLLPTDLASEEEEESSIIWMLASTGFGTGFIVTVTVLLVVPAIKDC